jgi:hypothetical protein
MFYETYNVCICKYMVRGEGEGRGRGRGRGRGTNGSISDVRYSDFQSTPKPPLLLQRFLPPHTHTNQDWNLYRNQIFSTLGWQGFYTARNGLNFDY